MSGRLCKRFYERLDQWSMEKDVLAEMEDIRQFDKRFGGVDIDDVDLIDMLEEDYVDTDEQCRRICSTGS